MPLTLVTGPANAAKAGAVLGAYRERLDEEPILVVPSFRDVEHMQREMAAHGAVFGTSVLRFGRLFDTIARRAGRSGRAASELQRELLLEEALSRLKLSALAESAGRPGFVRAATRFVAELERSLVEPAALGSALRRWAGDGPRRGYADDVAAIYAGYRDALDANGLADRELLQARALAALREDPASFGRTPVFLYGFDDLSELELATVETLAGPVAADVTVSLPYEHGRDAFRASARTFERLAAIAAAHVELEPLAEHYEPRSRAALHQLERRLFGATGARVPGGAAVALHSAGGERAEVELAGAAILDLLADGVPAGEIAVVFRDPERYGSLLEQVFTSYGIPFSSDRRTRLEHTALGSGLLALLRAATAGGGEAGAREASADDLLRYLRTPGRLERPGLADRLESESRRRGLRTATAARALWEEQNPTFPLEELDRLSAAASRGRLADQLGRELERLFARPYERAAHVFGPDELDDPRVFAAARRALAEIGDLAGRGAVGMLAPTRLHDALGRLRISLGAHPQPDRVHVADPLELRARRFKAVLVLGLQEGEFPRPARPEPFLSDEDRVEIARASGLALPIREDELERERQLFYVCASRPERLLVLSTRTSDEEGAPQAASSFVQDVLDLIDVPEAARRRRGLSDVVWSLPEAPTALEWERAAAAAGPRAAPPIPERLTDERVLAALAERPLSAATLESYSDCPVKWLVDRLLHPEALEPDAEPLVRGRFAHELLARVYRELAEQSGSRRVTPANLDQARRLLLDAIRDLRGTFPISPDRSRMRAALRRLEFDLLRYLAREAERGGALEPELLEIGFGGARDELPPATLGLEGVSISGRIDRVDTAGGRALVRDYKTGRAAYPVERWRRDRRLQVAVYMLALRELRPDLELAGGVYEPLAGSSPKPRGLLRKGLEGELGDGWTRTDWRDDEGFEAALSEAREDVAELIGRLRAGELRPCPDTCAWKGGCSYPSICRVER